MPTCRGDSTSPTHRAISRIEDISRYKKGRPKDVLIYSVLSLMKPLAIRLSQQAGKSLVIPRRRKSFYIKALGLRLAEHQFILSLSKDGDDE